MKKRITYILASFIMNCAMVRLHAQYAGDLDPTFGSAGSVITDLGNGYDQCSGLVVQPDQKTVIGGRALREDGYFYPTLIRMNADGTLDDTFDGDGIAYGNVKHSTTLVALGESLILQPDGKMLYAFLVGFFGEDGLAITRFNSDGSIDTDFGTDGTVLTVALGYSNYTNSLLLLADGKIMLLGYGQSSQNSNMRMLATRYTADGELDVTFAVNGIFSLDYGTGDDYILNAAQQSDGQVVMACRSGFASSSDFVVIRLNEDGTMDGTFGEAGIADISFSGISNFAKFLALRSDGSILVTGAVVPEGESSKAFALLSLTPEGVLDSNFGDDGITLTLLEGGDAIAEALAIASDGKILVAGHAAAFNTHGAVVRYSSDGLIDTSFGADGAAYIEAYSYHIENVKLQADGQIVVCGWTGYSDTNEHHFTASRLLYEDVNQVSNATIDAVALSVFPNPANDRITLQWQNKTTNEEVHISITDINGKVVWQARSSSFNQKQMDISQLSEGVYAISIQGNRTYSTSLFAISR